MSPFFAIFVGVAALLIVRSVLGFYRERELFARYDARAALVATTSTDEDTAAAEDDGSATETTERS